MKLQLIVSSLLIRAAVARLFGAKPEPKSALQKELETCVHQLTPDLIRRYRSQANVFCLWMGSIVNKFHRSKGLPTRDILYQFPPSALEDTLGENEPIFESANEICNAHFREYSHAIASNSSLQLRGLRSDIRKVSPSIAVSGMCTAISYYNTHKDISKPYSKCSNPDSTQPGSLKVSLNRPCVVQNITDWLKILDLGQATFNLIKAKEKEEFRKHNEEQNLRSSTNAGMHEKILEKISTNVSRMHRVAFNFVSMSWCTRTCSLFILKRSCDEMCTYLHRVDDSLAALIKPLRVPWQAFGNLQVVSQAWFPVGREKESEEFRKTLQMLQEHCVKLNKQRSDLPATSRGFFCHARIWLLILAVVPQRHHHVGKVPEMFPGCKAYKGFTKCVHDFFMTDVDDEARRLAVKPNRDGNVTYAAKEVIGYFGRPR